MKLKAMVVVDPVGNVAELLTGQCRRLAAQRAVATTGEQALNLVKELHPEVVVLSLEITRPTADKLVQQIIRVVPEVLVIGTYRELAVPQMQLLGRLGVDEFLAHPIAATEIFRAVSKRFDLPFRQFQRFVVDFEVRRGDGTSLGKALDISEGGLRYVCQVPAQNGESLLVDLYLPDGNPEPLRIRCQILAVSDKKGQQIARGQFETLRGESRQRLLAYLAKLQTKLDASTY